MGDTFLKGDDAINVRERFAANALQVGGGRSVIEALRLHLARWPFLREY